MSGQGYDGASNMRGAWNGLQALFLRDCPCAYYVHCFAHRLQLTLVAAAKEVHVIWNFFSHLDKIVNVITSSPKRVTDMQISHRVEIQRMLDTGICMVQPAKCFNIFVIIVQMVDLKLKVVVLAKSWFVSITKQLLQKLSYDDWEEFLQEVKPFCSKNNITIPDLEVMKHVKTTLRNKMEDDFLADCMILFIKRKLAEKIYLDSIIDEYYVSNPCRERLK
ncbi:uncharacterized protein LOC111406635 [Olea europaea var. sylvestris]|uniref:uncharacterized protein LOC111406635 n=1 Tax=Olea europaea var. sylvestris TaxID=158386 RepID=UPI000C1D1C15|nr:uncharacterized protein LOC111406635 [Olea europaea var. sylvestris]